MMLDKSLHLLYQHIGYPSRPSQNKFLELWSQFQLDSPRKESKVANKGRYHLLRSQYKTHIWFRHFSLRDT